jgi:hypothetical protein
MPDSTTKHPLTGWVLQVFGAAAPPPPPEREGLLQAMASTLSTPPKPPAPSPTKPPRS